MFADDAVSVAPDPKPKKNRELKTAILPIGVPTNGQHPSAFASPRTGTPPVSTPTLETPEARTPDVV